MPSIPLLTTKLYIPPPREEAVARVRLMTHLERGKTRPLTLVSAPAGFGKTTLVSSWVRGYGVRASWVSLDEGDNDPARFWLYTLAALQTHHPDLGQEVFALLQTAQPPTADLILSLLINELAALPEPLTLILDDYHVIENQVIHKGLMFLLDHLPAQLRLLLATRGDPPFALARLRARGQLAEIRIADLAFTPDETRVLFNEKMGLEICEEDVAALDARTEGWAAGLQLAALSLQGKQDVRGFIQAFTGSHAYIVDYLAEDVLLGQPDEVQTFLLQTSILAQMNAPLCDAVTGRKDSAAMLERLRQKNLFVIALDEARQWYRYHHLFAEVLRHRLQTASSPVSVTELHARAGHWFEQANLIEEAIRHAFFAQDLARAIVLIETYGEKWIRRGENQTAYSWLQQIPETHLLTHPRLCIIYALVLLWMHRLEEAGRYLTAAEHEIAPTQTHLKGQAFATRAFLALRQGQYDHTLALIEQAFALISQDDPNLMGRLKLAYGIALFWKDDHLHAAEAFDEATHLARQAEDWHTALYAMANYALMFSLRGQFRNAEKFFLQAVEFAVTYHMEYSLSANIVYGHLVDLGHEWNDFAMVDRYLEKSYKRTEVDQDPARKINVLFKAIKKELALRHFSDAARLIQACRELVEAHPHPEYIPYDLDYLQVRSWLLQGDLPSALGWAKALNLLAEDEVNTIREPLYIGLARILIANGEPARAV
ncbi:MAG: helix-turn-helix transcriptional regulator, partial [Anaerolineales bacterium]|nr:helix-turn-helix transcriptional regulator [Anaerolineales bacterium]